MSSKHALICGVSGQDGAYLTRHLLAKGYRVTGTSRDAELSSFGNLVRLGIRDHVKTRSMTLTDFRSVLFPGSARLVELADRMQTLQVEALCWFVDGIPGDTQWRDFQLTEPVGRSAAAAAELDALLEAR